MPQIPSSLTAPPRELPVPRWAGPAARRFMQRIERMWINWIQAGSGSPVLLLHGYGGSARWWTRNLQPLAQAHTVYALDLPGFGASRMPVRYSFERVISLLATWLNTNGLSLVYPQPCVRASRTVPCMLRQYNN